MNSFWEQHYFHNGNFKIKTAKQIAEIMGSSRKIRKKEVKPKAFLFSNDLYPSFGSLCKESCE